MYVKCCYRVTWLLLTGGYQIGIIVFVAIYYCFIYDINLGPVKEVLVIQKLRIYHSRLLILT